MTPEQIALVQRSWQQVLPIQAAAADLFYSRLFELAPDTRPLFKRDTHTQGAMLMATLDTVVYGREGAASATSWASSGATWCANSPSPALENPTCD